MLFVDLLLQVLNVTGPVFVLVILGLLLRRTRVVDDQFVQQASTLVFKAAMPAMIFIGILRADVSTSFDPSLGALFVIFSVVSFVLTWLWARARVHPREDRGVYVQGAFRSNTGMVGLALVVNQYGDQGLATASYLLALHAFIFNLMSILVLSYYSTSMRLRPGKLMVDVARNPLIVAVVVGLLANILGIRFTEWIENSVASFGSLTLTLGLICVGASLSFSGMRTSGGAALSAVGLRLVFIPAISAILLVAIGERGLTLGALYIFIASPTATASLVMARAAGSNASLAANIVVLSTLGAIITMPIGLLVLSYLELI